MAEHIANGLNADIYEIVPEEPYTDGADWLSGKRLYGSDLQETVMEWVNSLGLDFGE